MNAILLHERPNAVRGERRLFGMSTAPARFTLAAFGVGVALGLFLVGPAIAAGVVLAVAARLHRTPTDVALPDRSLRSASR